METLMRENKYFKLLKTLSKSEFKQYGKFLQSPLFNESSSFNEFYEYLKPFYPHFSDSHLDKNVIFKIFYPGDPYVDSKFRDRLTHSLSLLKKFIAISNFKSNELEFQKHLLLGVTKRGIDSIFEEEYTHIQNVLERTAYKDEDYYHKKYFLSSLFNSYVESKTTGLSKIKVYQDNSDKIDNIINFFLVIMMKEYSKMFNSEREIKIDYKYQFYEEVIHFLSKEDLNFKQVPIVSLLYKSICLYSQKKDITYIKELNQLLIDNKPYLSHEVYETIAVELYNYCIRMQSKGNKDFAPISFELMSQFLLEGLFLEQDGTMTGHAYINMAATAFRVKKMDWAESFIQEYKTKVKECERVYAYNYNYSVLLYLQGYGKEFAEKKSFYEKALQKLSGVKPNDYFFMTRIKNHELKIYYELNFTENALSLIDSYSHYLNRSKVIPKHLYESYTNFVQGVSKLIKIQLGHGFTDKNKLKSQIMKTENIEYKGWILDRIKEIS